jgi:hypothetical protein
MGTYTKTNADGTVVFMEGDGKESALIQNVTAALTLTSADSGKTLILKAAAGVAITLPAVTVIGFKIKVRTGLAFATTNFTIVSPTAVIQGGAIVNSTFVAAANENTISFVATAETLGDFVEIESDGTNYHVSGVAAAAGAITFTVV